MFTVTPSAAAQILHSAQQQSGPSSVRVAAKRGNDGSIVYGMGFDGERDNDLVLQREGITILIAPFSRDLLEGATLDFVEFTPGEFQFVFINPNDGPPAEEPAADGCAGGSEK